MVQTISTELLLEGFRYELETTRKRKTVNYYYGHTKRFLAWAESEGIGNDLRFINKQTILTFFHHLLETTEVAVGGNSSCRQIKRTEQTRWPYYRSLKRFFNWAVCEGYLERNPMDEISLKAPKAPPIEPYRAEHIQRMIEILLHNWEVAKTPRQRMLAARDLAVLLLFLESGLRCQEMAKLTIGDIDLTRQRVMVRDGKMGKGRLVGFGPRTKKAMWRYIMLRPQAAVGDALWATEEGRPMALEGVRQIIRRLKKEAGLEHVKGSVHKLRHTFATLYLGHTRDMKGCRILLGHSNLAMTERYTQFIEAEDALKAYDGQGPLDWLPA
jgi:site-specific recombinase XerD